MAKSIYLESGYVDMKKVLESPVPFSFIIGGRGTGKTYTGLQEIIKSGKHFIYLRRLETQAEIVAATNPLSELNRDHGWNYCTESVAKNLKGIYEGETQEDGSVAPTGTPIGYIAALSTFKNIRSVSFTDIDVIFYDEFIPEAHDAKIKGESTAFLNMYETVNRNRELQGRPPVKVVAASNAENLDNALFRGLQIIAPVAKAYRDGKAYTGSKEKGYEVYFLKNSPISEAKKNTALYKLAKGTDFYGMAIGNAFNTDFSFIKSMDLREFKPLVKIGEIEIYDHKSKYCYYVSTHKSGNCPEYTASDHDLRQVNSRYESLYFAYVEGNGVWFEDFEAKSLFLIYFGLA